MVETRNGRNDNNVDQPQDGNTHSQTTSQSQRQTQSAHWLTEEVDLHKYNSGLKLIPQFNGTNWDEFKRKLEMQFTIMSLDSYLEHPPNPSDRIEIRNDKLASAQICLRLTQSQYKQVSTCSTTSEIWKKLRNVYEQSAESKASNLFIQFIHRAVLRPENYRQIKAAARASQGMTMPRLTNLLLSAERDEQIESRAQSCEITAEIGGTAQGATQAHTIHHIAGLSEGKTPKSRSPTTRRTAQSRQIMKAILTLSQDSILRVLERHKNLTSQRIIRSKLHAATERQY
uniref:Uncharacterized protein n=1 Tax=Spongospora subterranea TaxID=70186 RepID=A0A0H5R2B5_9EUKA|eukprot:CRZ08100.1 hypothetical protein [Spongospora subterranea]